MNCVPNEHIELAKADIEQIDRIVENGSAQEWISLHRTIDGRYQACIQNWFSGFECLHPHRDSVIYWRLEERPEKAKHNLMIMKAKLESYCLQANAISEPEPTSTEINVTTNVNVSITFDKARQKVEDMTALSQEQTDEVIEKINELEKISKENTTRKKKWEKVKPIISFALDKGADIAIMILSLVLQMRLGM
ncbi:MAG: hypothetical protein E7424_01040 [Ruminococcaceae bacterium]|jgi:uncharacterized protein (DUF2252 family)|nr:hypothetical protein [Oscillospiraceae bacterium]